MQNDDRPRRATTWHDPLLLRFCAAAGFAGCVALFAGNVIGSVIVPGHDWISDTISQLAAGPYEIVQDVALYAYASGLIALAVGGAHAHPGGWRWSAGLIALCILALLITMIGARNEYGDSTQGGLVIHTELVVLMGVAYAGGMVATAPGLGRERPWMRPACLALAAAWSVGAILYFAVAPDAIKGAWERGLGLFALAWALLLSDRLRRTARRAAGA